MDIQLNSFFKLKENLIKHIIKFNNNLDILKLLNCNNRKIHKILYEIKHRVFQHFYSNPLKLNFHSIFCEYDGFSISNNFTFFRDYHKQLVLAFPTKSYSLDLYYVKNNEFIKSLLGHFKQIYCVRYHKDPNKTKFLITSSQDRSIKIWKVSDYTLFVSINSCFSSDLVFSCLMINFGHKIFVVATACSNELIKVFNLKGENIRKIGYKKDTNLFIDTWFNINSNQLYILNGNDHDVKLYYFKNGNLFKSFKDKWSINTSHWSGFIKDNQNSSLLIESDNQGTVRIWDVISGELQKSFSTSCEIITLIPWNDKYVIICSFKNKNIEIIDLNSTKSIGIPVKGGSKLSGSIQKFYHSKYGECIMTGGLDEKLYLWNIDLS